MNPQLFWQVEPEQHQPVTPPASPIGSPFVPYSPPRQTTIIVETHGSQALPALASFFLPGLGQLIQGRVIAGVLWFLTYCLCGLSLMAIVGFVLLPLYFILWIVCVVECACWKPKRRRYNY